MRIIVASEEDPVGREVARRLGTGRPTPWSVGEDEVRELAPELLVLRRRALHIHDERLDEGFPAELAVRTEVLVFPSVHRSASDRPTLTVHPLGNLGPEAEVGGRPRELNPVPARWMSAAFLGLRELGSRAGVETTFEATHHGPSLRLPSFFIEIGSTKVEWEREDLLDGMTALLRGLSTSTTRADTIALGIGGGHYVPRFRDLVRRRRVSFGHLVPRHHRDGIDREMAEQLVARTPGVEGIVYAKGEARLPGLEALLPALEEKDLPLR